MAAIHDSVKAEVEVATAPLRQDWAQTQKHLAKIPMPTRHTHPAGVHAGGASYGGDAYRFGAAIEFARSGDRDAAKAEADLSDRLKAAYQRAGLNPTDSRNVFVPLSADHIAAVDPVLAEEVRQSVPAGAKGADPGELAYLARRGVVRQSLSQFDDTGMGIFVGGGDMEMIDLLRAREAFSRLGARELTLPPNGRLTMGRQTGATETFWIGERGEIPESEPETGLLSFLARKMACLVKAPNELIRFGGPTAEAFIRNDMARSMAVKADLAFLTGAGGSFQPLGLLNTPGVERVSASTAGVNGDTLEPADLTRMRVAVEEKDVDPDRWGWLMRPTLLGQLLERRASAVATGDREGAYLFPANRGDIADGAPARLRGYPVVTSTQVPNDRAKGTAENLTALVAGDWSEAIVARAGVLEISSSGSGDTAFTRDETWFRAIQHLDFGLRRTEAFAVIDTLVPNLTP